ncbi:hypothetical protein FGG08_004277 [Glutinoglossum americanum]|uniref:Amidohydrolase-related domain-containing protein n=1 Tax=Glutinoglossum americanum TaxID=1670608 RepID=A0A9P8L426_9PEZI|nr:hypothetical protein FGG08_004277 [Glutinoglossum americanum]
MGNPPNASSIIIFGTFIDVPSPTELRIRENHVCVVNRHGIIVKLAEAPPGLSEEELLEQVDQDNQTGDWQIIRLGDGSREVVFPGLIDCVKIPCHHVSAGFGHEADGSLAHPLGTKTDLPLMQWLNQYTFPEESRFSDPDYANKVYPRLVRRLLRNGTTTALYFASSHLEATKVLAKTCAEMGQRAFVGKNCSDGELCPEYYRETTEGSTKDTREFVEWCRAEFGKEGRVRAVVTPRFVGVSSRSLRSLRLSLTCHAETPTCTPSLLKALGSIAREYDVAIQTHAAETVDQVALVAQKFPAEKRDIPILRASGLLTPRTILAHGCHLTTSEVRELVEADVAVTSCPYSNILFSRATLPIPRFHDMGLKIGLGTDISGGWSSSIWENARLAVLQDRVDSFVRTGTHSIPEAEVEADPGWEVTFVYALYLSTVGGARSLGLHSDEGGVGLFEVGREFDAVHVGLDVEDQRFEFYEREGVRDRFERFVLGGDDRNVVGVWVGGRKVWERGGGG